jgi:hypothetical protein
VSSAAIASLKKAARISLFLVLNNPYSSAILCCRYTLYLRAVQASKNCVHVGCQCPRIFSNPYSSAIQCNRYTVYCVASTGSEEVNLHSVKYWPVVSCTCVAAGV